MTEIPTSPPVTAVVKQPLLRAIQSPWHWFTKLCTHEFTITQGSIILIASFFTSAVLGAIRQVLFNAQFGVGPEANAYYAAFRLPDTLFSLIAGGALSSAMIPVLIGTSQREGAEARQRLVRMVLTSLMLVMVLIVLLLELFTPLFVRYLLAPGFDAETSQLTVTLTRIKLLQPLILAIGSVATALLHSRNRFLLPAVSILSYNLTLIGGILLVRSFPDLGVYAPTLGIVVGAVLQVLILLPGFAELRGRHWLLWQPRDRHLREVVYLLIPNGLSTAVNYGGSIVDTAFASLTAQLVSLPALYNATLLANLPITLLGYAVGLAAFPRFSVRGEAREWRSMQRLVIKVLSVACGLTLIAYTTIYFLGRTVVHILFEHGQFDAAAGDVTYGALLLYATGLPAHVATEIITRGLIALRDTRTPLLTNVCQLAGRIAIMTLLIDRLGLYVIPIALVTTSTLEAVVLGTILWMKLQRRIRHE